MICSLNEVESLARKAARGAHLPWGIAEEAGKVTRWLCAAGLPGGEALAGLLRRNDGVPLDVLSPVETGAAQWRAAGGGVLCPLLTGAALCDLAGDLGARRVPLNLGATAYPLLLVPYVVMVAEATRADCAIAWPGARLSHGPEGCAIDATPERLLQPEVAQVLITFEAVTAQPLHRAYRAAITKAAFDALGALAHRTYAPETETSRLAGAGAGLTDND